ncbi:MAG: L-threonylcarbamoyladenylate synthase [Thermoleophilia bacterium]|nr:L-threonylcarbamoyladenylate synthase [Thermoleophilia bacterium]
MAEIIQLKSLNSSILGNVADSLRTGGLVCLPSDTVYGLTGLCTRPEIRGKISETKNRPADKPLALIFGDVRDVLDALPSLPDGLRFVVAKLLPGPVTVVVPASPVESEALGLPGLKSVGIRVIPPPLNKLYRLLPGPLFATSANIAGEADPCLVNEISQKIRETCDFVIDAGARLPCVASTVVDLGPLVEGGTPGILRQGAMPEEEILKRVDSCGCF